MKAKHFFTPESVYREQQHRMESNQGQLLVASCRSASYMTERVVDVYERLLKDSGSSESISRLDDIDESFSDSETKVRISRHVGGADVFLFQSLLDPRSDRTVNDNYMRFLIAVRAFREHGANRITAVLPYLAYARQDKPTKFKREPTTARLMADLGLSAGIDRVISWDPHSGPIRGFYGQTPTNMLDPLSLFTDFFSEYRGRPDVIAVAPDAGATKLIMHFAKAMELQSAVAVKYRPEQEESKITDVIGDFTGKRRAIVLDDMISSAGTVGALVKLLAEKKGIEEVFLAASHNLCMEQAFSALTELHRDYGLKKVFITNSIPQLDSFEGLDFLTVMDLSGIFARTINRIHYNYSVSEIFL